MNSDEDNGNAAGGGGAIEVKELFDINIPADTDEEIANVDASDDEGAKGPNAAEALRAQVNAQAREEGQQNSSSSSSSSESSGSGSGSRSSSSNSDSESSDAESVDIV